MLIKQQALAGHLRQKLAAVYILFGQDHYLLEEAALAIKAAWRAGEEEEPETTVIHINSPSDWKHVEEESNSYSLFASKILLDLRYEKKTMEAAGKELLTSYLQNPNPSCLLLLRAGNLPQKQLQWLINDERILLVQASPLTEMAMRNWIAEQLQKKMLKFDQQVPALIQQYTQGNMLASAQAVERLELIADENIILSPDLVKEQLINQCDYQLFELADACLSQNSTKAIQLLRHVNNSKAEPTLILWLLAQEVRLLTQLLELSASMPFNAACSQLKIWPQRARLYQQLLKKMDLTTLYELLRFCKTVDERIKSNNSGQVWHALEQIALSLCLARRVGSFA